MSWLAGRVGVSIVLIWLVSTLVFMVIHVVPGDPAELLLSAGGVAPDPAAVADLREHLGLNDPLLLQYLHWLAGLLHGDLGSSMADDLPVAQEIALRLPRTLELIAPGRSWRCYLGCRAGPMRRCIGAAGSMARPAGPRR